MRITWIGHSCFKIEIDGYSIITDPYADGSVPGYTPVRETADMVLCSHEHADHNYRDGVELVERTGIPLYVIDSLSESVTQAAASPLGDSACGGFPFRISTIDTYHDEACGAERGSNRIFIIEAGGTRIAHFGDLGCELTPAQMNLLQRLDVAMLPVGGYFTIDAKQAADLVHELNPGIVIPMHYRSDVDGFGYDVIGTVAEFTELIESRAVQNRAKSAMARPASTIRYTNHGHNMDSVKTMPGSEIDTNDDLGAQAIVLRPGNMKKQFLHRAG